MFKYRFLCKNKEMFIKGIEDKMFYDRPVEYSLFADFFGRGIHFRENGEQVKGYFFYQRDGSSPRGGSPIQVKFKGSFVEDDGKLFFDVRIYPRLIDVLFWIAAYISCIVVGRWDGILITVVVSFIFFRGFYKSIKETARIFDRMII